MKVRQLISFLKDLPQDSEVYIDMDEYPRVDGAYSPDDGDEITPIHGWIVSPRDIVFLEVSYPESKDDE